MTHAATQTEVDRELRGAICAMCFGDDCKFCGGTGFVKRTSVPLTVVGTMAERINKLVEALEWYATMHRNGQVARDALADYRQGHSP